jgi:high-affinity nickel-transport protein
VCLAVLFAAGMTLLDTLEGSVMNFAYGWALSEPVRKVFYNIAITGLSVLVAAVIGTVEVGGLIASHLKLSGGFWTWFENLDINSLGICIAGLFVGTWVIALSVWRFGRIEERWSAGPETVGEGRRA